MIANRSLALRAQQRQLWVTNGPQDQTHPTSVDPPIPDEIAATRKSAVPCQEQSFAIAIHQGAGCLAITAFFHENSNARWKPGAMSLASGENEFQYAAEDVAAEILRA
jgi:hypothetical protein